MTSTPLDGLGRKIARFAGSGGFSALLTTRRYDKAQGLSELVRVIALRGCVAGANYASISQVFDNFSAVALMWTLFGARMLFLGG